MTARYEDRDITGMLVDIHERIAAPDGGKRYIWRQPDGTLGLNGTPVGDLPLYGIHRDVPRSVVVTEGEKCAEALWSINVPAVGTVTGAAATPSRKALADLAGKRVYLWPDHDEVGHEHMVRVAAGLKGIAASILWVTSPTDAPKGWDAADATREQVKDLIAAAVPYGDHDVDADDDVDHPVLPDRPHVEANGKARRRLDIIRAADVQPLAVSWLWCRYIPRGMLSLFDGDPGLGKSTIAYDLAARITTGRPMPDGSPGTLGDVLVFSAEDAIEYVIVPRLLAAGADMSRVRIVKGSRAPDDEDAVAVTLPDDLAAIGDALDGVVLAIIDPLMAYLSSDVNSHRDQDIRRVLAALSRLADESSASFVIVRHLNKATGASALYRGGGSIGIIGAARAAYIFGQDPDDETLRLMASNKINIGMKPDTMAYRLVDTLLPDHPGVSVARVEWEGTSSRGAEEIIRPRTDEDRSEGSEAVEFLRDLLSDGPVPTTDLKDEARGRGIAWRTAERAKASLGVVARKVGRPGETGQRWTWSLPEDRQDSPKDANTQVWRSSPNVGGLRGDSDPTATPGGRPDTALPCPTCGQLMVTIPGSDRAVCTNPAGHSRPSRTCPSCLRMHSAGTTCGSTGAMA